MLESIMLLFVASVGLSILLCKIVIKILRKRYVKESEENK